MLAIILLAEQFGVSQNTGLGDSLESAAGIVVLVIIYVLPGVIGALVAAVAANRVQRWALHSLGL
jgi:hypothetical protein